jgi:hypothetical protein
MSGIFCVLSDTLLSMGTGLKTLTYHWIGIYHAATMQWGCNILLSASLIQSDFRLK